MCLDCGCHKPDEQHGDARHITMQDLRDAADASHISVDEVVRRISQESRQSTGAGATSAQ